MIHMMFYVIILLHGFHIFHLTSPHLVPSVALPSKGPQLPLLGPPAKQGLGRFLGPLNEAQQIHKGKGLMDRIWDIIWYNWD